MSIVSELCVHDVQDLSRKFKSIFITEMRMEEREKNRKLIHSNSIKLMLFSGLVLSVFEDGCYVRIIMRLHEGDARVVLRIITELDLILHFACV